MVTTTYRLEPPLQLAVEADTWVEARDALAALWGDTLAVLPTGVSSTLDVEDVLQGKGIEGPGLRSYQTPPAIPPGTVLSVPPGTGKTATAEDEHTGGIHAVIAERVALANAYAQDGAFRSAARVLSELAGLVTAHAIRCGV